MQPSNDNDFMKELTSFRPKLVKQAAALMGNIADAEDLVHSAFERALRSRHALRPDTRLCAWLSTVTRNLAIDQMRTPARCRTASIDVSDLPGPDGDSDSEASHWWEELSEAEIRRALARCSPVLREAFELHHYAGLSLNSIAARTGAPASTIATRIFRARATLRRVLMDERAPARRSACADVEPCRHRAA